MTAVSFDHSQFQHITVPISIDNAQLSTDIHITNCDFFYCDSGVVFCKILNGFISITNSAMRDCFSETLFYGLHITIIQNNLCSLNQFSACNCVSTNKGSFGNNIESESLGSNTNFSDVSSGWESAIKFYSDDNKQISFLYSNLANCNCMEDTLFSTYGSSSVVRSITISNFTIYSKTSHTFYVFRAHNSIIENSNFEKGNANSIIIGNGHISYCWIHSSIEAWHEFIVDNKLTNPTNIVIASLAPKNRPTKRSLTLGQMIGVFFISIQLLELVNSFSYFFNSMISFTFTQMQIQYTFIFQLFN